MAKSSAHGRLLVSLAFAWTLTTVYAASAVADPPAKAKHAGSGTSVNDWRKWWGTLRQFGAEIGQLLVPPRPQPPTDPRRSMLIRVVDPAGKPVVGATVTPVRCIHRQEDVNAESEASRELGWSQTAIGTDGSVRIARPIASDNGIDVQVEAEGFVSVSAGWNEDGQVHEPIPSEFTFKLERSRPIGGVVRDPAGRPIAGAQVTLSLSGDDGKGRVRTNLGRREERTNWEGRWRCGCLPSRVEGLTIAVKHDCHVEREFDEAAVAAQLADLRAMKAVLVMRPGLVVRGTVADERGKPVPDADVQLSPGYMMSGGQTPTWDRTTTGDDGRYCFAACSPGDDTVYVSAPRLAEQARDITIRSGMAPVDFRLKPGPAVKIRVVDAAGRPLAGTRRRPKQQLRPCRWEHRPAGAMGHVQLAAGRDFPGR